MDPNQSLFAQGQTDPGKLRIEDFHYDLPKERIAQYPSERREEARLLQYRSGAAEGISDHVFGELPDLLPRGVHLIVNDTRVLPARILRPLDAGKMLEIFLLEPAEEDCWWCLIGQNRHWKSGELTVPTSKGGLHLQRLESRGKEWRVKLTWDSAESEAVGAPDPATLEELLEEIGDIPLPPYVQRPAESLDRLRYQTTYARSPGAVAAPTAGLHLTPGLLEGIKQRGGACHAVTLHVGAGTFLPVKTDCMGDHPMHSERISVRTTVLEDLMGSRGPWYAVGTTTLRMMESLYWMAGLVNRNGGRPVDAKHPSRLPDLDQWEPYRDTGNTMEAGAALASLLDYARNHGLTELSGRTRLLIAPPYRLRTVQGLITNFHQPQSTLLLLVAALVGDEWRRIYSHALRQEYRFLSYGDGSLLHL